VSGESHAEVPAGPRIHRLPDDLVDQIAAGEVVERPASVVKELAENALDAGASRVRVEIRDGGRSLIAVSDDGCGMTREEARLALERHATSKIRDADDLARIRTFGFRGEALPAIASVARVRLRTRAAAADEAFELEVEAGRLLREGPAGGPPGTRVEVADLFAPVPARRKFLKSAATEWGHIADWLTRLALARPELHLELLREERPALAWPAVRDLRERVAVVLSEDDAASLVPVEAEDGALRLTGYASRPDHHRASGAGIHLFVNRRPVRDRLLRHALLEAYREWLPRGRFPAAVLHLDCDPARVDVNVHPAKWEVRFAEPQRVHALVRRALREAVSTRGWLGGPAAAGRPGSGAADAAPHGPGRGRAPSRAAAPAEAGWILAERPEPAAEEGRAGPVPRPGSPAPERPVRFSDFRLLGQLHATYLLLEGPASLLLVDQHAAHERVLYEDLRAGLAAGGIARQGLLGPARVELPPALRAALVEGAGHAAKLGFEIDPFDEESVLVRAVPALLAGRDPHPLVRELAEELARGGVDAGASPRRPMRDLDTAIATIACHAAVRAGDRLEPPEQAALLRDLDRIPHAPCCPHGRPVAVPLPIEELERRFARR